MILILAMAAALYGIGAVMKVPLRVRFVMLGLLWLAVVGLHLVLPDGHPLRVQTGGSAQGWLALGVIVGLALGYRSLLARLRRRAQPVQEPVRTGAFRPAELDRYARHILLREIGGPGQRKLKDARVLVIGAGGLGAPALMYLAAAGVGTIGVLDDDTVEGSNLQRQIIHADDRIGMPKVFSAETAMKALNPFSEVRPYNRRLDAESAAALLADYDLILDGTDNFDTRYLVNRICADLGKPLVAGAITQWEGQLSLWHPAAGGPCYECVFPTRPPPAWCRPAPRQAWPRPCPA